jgi:hypothetical protein
MAVVPATRTWVAGEVVTAAHFNTNIRDVFNYLLAKPILKCRQTGAQSIANNTHTALTFGAEDVDSSGMHSTSVNTSRATAVYAGWYSPSGGTSFAGNTTGVRGTYWSVNATPVNGSNTLQIATSAAATQFPARTDLVFLNVNDYLEEFTYQNSGGSLNTSVTAQEQPSMVVRWESN